MRRQILGVRMWERWGRHVRGGLGESRAGHRVGGGHGRRGRMDGRTVEEEREGRERVCVRRSDTWGERRDESGMEKKGEGAGVARRRTGGRHGRQRREGEVSGMIYSTGAPIWRGEMDR